MDFAVYNGMGDNVQDDPMEDAADEIPFRDWPHYRPVTPPHHKEEWDSYCRNMVKLSDHQVGLPTQPVMPMLNRAMSLTSPTKTLPAILQG